jgi:hypothetical protein
VQHFGEGLGRGFKVKALSGRVVIGADESEEAPVRQRGKVCLARQEAAHPADGILDPAFLPWCIGITEERLDAEAVEFMMVGELGAVVEGDGPPQRLGQACEQPLELARDRLGGFAVRPCGEQDARLSFVHGEHGLAVFREHHQVGFPVAVAVAAIGGQGAF